MASFDPTEQKYLGRAVSDFNDDVWVRHRLSIVRQANLRKIVRNPELLRSLLGTSNNILGEASPFDILWSIGFRTEDPQPYHPSLGKGSDLLGRLLMPVHKDPPPPPPPLL